MRFWATLFVIVIYVQIARFLLTGVVLFPGGGRAHRSERPVAYWFYVICYLVFPTLVLVELCTGRIR